MNGRMPTTSTRLGLGAGIFLLAACSAAGGPAVTSGQPAESASPSASPSGSPGPSVSPGSLVPAELLQPVLEDASSQSGVPANAITIVKATPVTWNDGSLGCPQPGVVYTQALVDGWQVIVEAGGTRIDYRVTGPGRFVICKGLSSH